MNSRWGRCTIAIAVLCVALCSTATLGAPPRPNIVLILADDLGYSDLGSYGSEVATPNLNQLAAQGLRFTQFYNAARCCPTRASLLTGLYPHQAGVGHMLQDWQRPAYQAGLNEHCATMAELLATAGYRSYHVGKWHVGGLGNKDRRNHPLRRGFARAYGNGGGGGFFVPTGLYLDHEPQSPDPDYYVTDAFSDWAVRFLEDHVAEAGEQPFFLHLCYTAPHFPLQAKPADIERHRGHYREGWDALRASRFARQRDLGIVDPRWRLSPRDPVAQAWEDVSAANREEWDLRMAVHAAMIDCMDQGIGRVMATLRRLNREENTLVLFLSDNGASAEFLDTWPNPARGHRPGSLTGTAESHRCLEVGWANAANTPFREHKMWAHEGGIATPLIARWPAGIAARGKLTRQVGHIIDLMPTLLDLAGASYPATWREQALTPLAGKSLVPVFEGGELGPRVLGWEHEGNRALRQGDWKLVAPFGGDWELYDLAADRTETNDLAGAQPERVAELAAEWQAWADRVGVVPWSELPGAKYQPSAEYRKKSEPASGPAGGKSPQ